MYLIGDQPAYAEKLINSLQRIPAQLLDGLAPCGEPIELDAVDDLYEHIGNNRIYLLKSGLLHAEIEQKPIFYVQEGDLIGLRQGLNTAPCTYKSEEPLVLVPFDREALFKHIHSSSKRQEQFTQYILGQAALMSDALAHSRPPAVPVAQGVARRVVTASADSSARTAADAGPAAVGTGQVAVGSAREVSAHARHRAASSR